MRVVFMNLDRDVARRDFIVGQLERLGLEYERFPAISPATMTPELASRFGDGGSPANMSPGEIANFASHLAILEQVARQPDDAAWTLVLEDDVLFEIDAPTLKALAAEALAADADIVRLSAPAKHSFRALARAGDFWLVKYLVTPLGAGAFLVRPRGARRLLDRARGLRIVSDCYFREEAVGGVATLGVMPVPIPQDRFGVSSIDPTEQRQTESGFRKRRFSYERGTLSDRVRQRIRFLRWFGGVDLLRAALNDLSRSVLRAPKTFDRLRIGSLPGVRPDR